MQVDIEVHEMSEKQSSVKINETHLGYIQAVINRMGQNSFQAKTETAENSV